MLDKRNGRNVDEKNQMTEKYKWEMQKPLETTDEVKWKSTFFEILEWCYENISLNRWNCNNKGEFYFTRQEDLALFTIFVSSIKMPPCRPSGLDAAFFYAPYIPLQYIHLNVTVTNSVCEIEPISNIGTLNDKITIYHNSNQAISNSVLVGYSGRS